VEDVMNVATSSDFCASFRESNNEWGMHGIHLAFLPSGG
jgi:hypothetical protein